MTISITYGPWGETLEELVDAGRRAEAAGADVIWVPELHRSATVGAAALAAGTSTVGVGTAIALAFTRSPMVTALEALDVDEMSGGRFILGIGSGVQRLNEDWHNAQWGKPVAHMRETIAIIRHFIANSHLGERMTVEGEYERIDIRGYQRPFAPVRTEIPIYVAGMGPVMTKLAGEIGDGWISHELCSPRYMREQLLPWLEEGLAKSGRPRKKFDVVVSAACAIDDDPQVAKRWNAGLIGFYATVKTYAEFFEFHGLAAEQQAIIEKFKSGVSSDHLGDIVPDHMVDALTLAGTAEEVRDRISEYEGIVDSVKLTPPTHGLTADITRKAQNQILEMIPVLTGKR
ncbi:MAG: LLM class flavin-dependent oxidoreductase [Actinobacteria bacterium]|nr:LLM class flavin-dependent oxidoreductase [Actinomycetota bacterium]